MWIVKPDCFSTLEPLVTVAFISDQKCELKVDVFVNRDGGHFGFWQKCPILCIFRRPNDLRRRNWHKIKTCPWKPHFSTFSAAAILNFSKNVLIPVFWAARSSRDVHFTVKSKRLVKSSFFCILSGGHFGFRQICYSPYFGIQNRTASPVFPKIQNCG